jgi:hypothetical protein
VGGNKEGGRRKSREKEKKERKRTQEREEKKEKKEKQRKVPSCEHPCMHMRVVRISCKYVS